MSTSAVVSMDESLMEITLGKQRIILGMFISTVVFCLDCSIFFFFRLDFTM